MSHEDALNGFPPGMRQTAEDTLLPEEPVLAAWATRGPGANGLICAAQRALVVKKPGLVNWSVSSYRYRDLSAVKMIWASKFTGGSHQLLLATSGDQLDAEEVSAMSQDMRRVQAPNVVIFRKKDMAREALQTLEQLIADRVEGTQIAAEATEQRDPGERPALTGELERLVSLRDKGALSEEEFAQAKARLLGA